MDLTTVTDLRPAAFASASGAGSGAGAGAAMGDPVPGTGALPGWEPGDCWLGGGTWLFSEPQPGARRLLDLTALGWPAIDVARSPLDPAPSQADLVIGATCTVAELRTATASFEAHGWSIGPLVRRCCEAFVASFKVLNVATVGGNLATALPAGPMISLLAALDGECTLWTPAGGRRAVPVLELVTGDGRTALARGEVIRSIRVPARVLRSRTAMRRQSLTTLGRSAALVIGRSDGADLHLTVTASTVRPVRIVVPVGVSAAVLRERVEAAIPARLYHDDVHGLPSWRRHLTLLLAEQLRAELAAEPTAEP